MKLHISSIKLILILMVSGLLTLFGSGNVSGAPRTIFNAGHPAGIDKGGSDEDEEEISFDDVEEEEDKSKKKHPMTLPGGIFFNLYADFTIEYKSTEIAAKILDNSNNLVRHKSFFSFDQNHFNLMGRVGFRDKVLVMFDLDSPYNFFEINTKINKMLSLKFGKIFVPFGEPDFHHLYGGQIDEDNYLLPLFWCDYGFGVKLKAPIADFDFFVVNGFPVDTKGSPVFDRTGTTDHNKSKAFGVKAKLAPSPKFTLGMSTYVDHFSTNDYVDDFALFYGFDFLFGIKKVDFRGGFYMAEIRDKTAGYFSKGILENTYSRNGYFLELAYRINDMTKVKLRGGAMDPNSQIKDVEDQANINASVFINVKPFVISIGYFYNWQLFERAQMTDQFISGTQLNNYHAILTKILLKI